MKVRVAAAFVAMGAGYSGLQRLGRTYGSTAEERRSPLPGDGSCEVPQAGSAPKTAFGAEPRRALMTSPSEFTQGSKPSASVDLYWLPLGAGGHSVRFNGIVYEAISSRIQHRPRCDVYHSALRISTASGQHSIEMTPVPNRRGRERGVVAEGPVGTRSAGRLRIFRYEIRRWHDGVIPDLEFAVDSPVRVSDDPEVAQRVLDLLSSIPTPTWGRDELQAGEMWSCNSIISWVIARAGVDARTIPLPTHARAPGWDAGIVVAERNYASSGVYNPINPRRDQAG